VEAADLFNGGAAFGGSWRQTGLIFNYVRKQSDGSRENIHAGLNDLSLKVQPDPDGSAVSDNQGELLR
jgi:hypothetical protein